jgi:hypothetical protein
VNANSQATGHAALPPALAAARTALRDGRIGLPWNVQADLVVPDPAPSLDDLGLRLVDQVHALVGLPVQRVFATPPTSHAWVLCLDHTRGLTSTLAVGFVGVDVATLHRFRVSGSHGTLLVDATGPGVQVHTGGSISRTWAGAGTHSMDGVRTDAGAAQRVVDAAHRSAVSGSTEPIVIEHED